MKGVLAWGCMAESAFSDFDSKTTTNRTATATDTKLALSKHTAVHKPKAKKASRAGLREIYGLTGEVRRAHLPPRAEQIIHVGHDTLSASDAAIHNSASPPMRFGCAQNGGSCARASTELVPCVVVCVYARARVCV